MVKHTGEYLYSCQYCPKSFKFNSGICRHYKAFHPIEYNAERASNMRKKYQMKDMTYEQMGKSNRR